MGDSAASTHVQWLPPDSLVALTRYVVRTFYDDMAYIVFDFIVRQLCVRESELVQDLQIDVKILREGIKYLVDDRLLKSEEVTDPNPNPHHKRKTHTLFYYVDFRDFVNVVKFKLDRMRVVIGDTMKNAQEAHGMLCPQCGKQFRLLDINRLIDMMTGVVQCDICQSELEEEAESADIANVQQRQARLNEQVRKVVGLVKDLDGQALPARTLDDFDVVQATEVSLLRAQRQAENAAMSWNAQGGGDGMGLQRLGVRGGLGYNPLGADQEVGLSIDIIDDQAAAAKAKSQAKVRAAPAWTTQSTVEDHSPPPSSSSSSASSSSSSSTAAAATAAAAASGSGSAKRSAVEADIGGDEPSAVRVKVEAEEGEGGAGYEDFQQRYLEQIKAGNGGGGGGGDEVAATVAATTAAAPAPAAASAASAEGATADTPGAAASETPAEAEAEAGKEDPLVSIGSRKVPLSQVSEADQKQMSDEEYNEYSKLLQEDQMFFF